MYAIAIPRFIPQLYEHLFLLNTTKMSSQCLGTGMTKEEALE
ncbi:hypothetical protein [Wolbachia endosymbiont of Psylliodes chrysocephala]|nr:hypothetical protein [Wolbachia endosymbiont of Psylliodes chrysocephala]